MRKDKQKRLERFADLIAKTISAADPVTMKLFEGFSWAALPQAVWCKKLGISDRTLRALAKSPPIVATKIANEEGKPLVLYRLGSEPHKSARHVANILAKLYRDRYEVERVSRRDWGCLFGLATAWPEDVQPDIFRMLLTDLKPFMAAIKATDPDCPHSDRYYKWLPIPLVRKYHSIALELYIASLQEAGKQPPPSIASLFPKLWPKKHVIG